MTIAGPDWVCLSPGQGARVPFSGDDGGAFAWGLISTLAAVWIHSPPGEIEQAFCQHLPAGPISPAVHHRACDEIGFSRDNDPRLLRVLIASQRTITEQDERAFLLLGVLPDQLYTYSNSLLTQFGVSRRGCAGEAG